MNTKTWLSESTFRGYQVSKFPDRDCEGRSGLIMLYSERLCRRTLLSPVFCAPRLYSFFSLPGTRQRNRRVFTGGCVVGISQWTKWFIATWGVATLESYSTSVGQFDLPTEIVTSPRRAEHHSREVLQCFRLAAAAFVWEGSHSTVWCEADKHKDVISPLLHVSVTSRIFFLDLSICYISPKNCVPHLPWSSFKARWRRSFSLTHTHTQLDPIRTWRLQNLLFSSCNISSQQSGGSAWYACV